MDDEGQAMLATAKEIAEEAYEVLGRAHAVLAQLATSLGRDGEASIHAERADVIRDRLASR